MGDVIKAVPSAGGQRLIARVEIVGIVALALAIGCSSSKPARVVEAAPPRPAPAAAAAGNRASSSPTELRSLELREGAPEVYVDLEASAPLVWTSFRNSQGDVVLELPNSVPSAAVADLAPEDGLISTLKVERVADGSQPLTRLIIATRQTVEHSVTAEGMALKLRLQPVEENQQRARDRR